MQHRPLKRLQITLKKLIIPIKVMDRELYDKTCKVLTWYEHPEESPLDEKEVSEKMYSTLVEVQNAMCNEYGF